VTRRPPPAAPRDDSHPGSLEVVHRLRDARAWTNQAADTSETCDLVIVGGIPREVFDIKVDATILGGQVLFERS